MDEARWLSSTDPMEMLRFLHAAAAARKTLLLTCACFRQAWPLLPDACRQWAEAAERVADGLARRDQLNDEHALHWLSTIQTEGLLAALMEVFGCFWQVEERIAEGVGYPSEQAKHAALVRHIFGNPFRPFTAPAYLPAAVVQLAEALYQGQDCRLP